jgi:hypothetical protein
MGNESGRREGSQQGFQIMRFAPLHMCERGTLGEFGGIGAWHKDSIELIKGKVLLLNCLLSS